MKTARKISFVLLVISCLLIIAAFIPCVGWNPGGGLSPAGVLLSLAAGSAVALAFIHTWRRQYCNMSKCWIDKHEDKSKADVPFDCDLLCGTDSRVFRFHSCQSTELMSLQTPALLLDGSVLKICKNFCKGAFKCKCDR